MSDDRRGLAALLLVFQSGLYLLAAFGLSSFARFANAGAALAGPELVAFAGPFAPLLLAIGVMRNSRFFRFCVYVAEGVVVLGTAFSVLASAGSALTLTIGITGFALPASIVFLVKTGGELRKGLLIGLLMTTALIHLALVPEHLSEPPKLGGLFALDALAFVAMAIAATKDARWWRLPTAVLLLATIFAYAVVVVSGKELVDDLGVATKLIELVAFGLVVWPRQTQLSVKWLFASASLVTAMVLSGGMVWAASLRPNAAEGHAHGGATLIQEAPPTDEQRAAAAKLVEDTRAGIARFADMRVAFADGYRRSPSDNGPTVHYLNPNYVTGNVELDPTRPQALVYANTGGVPKLLGAMYMMPRANMRPPDVGGSLTEWHVHSNICFLGSAFAIDGLQSPFGTCPVGSINGPTPAMLHVWTVPNPAGQFTEQPPGTH